VLLGLQPGQLGLVLWGLDELPLDLLYPLVVPVPCRAHVRRQLHRLDLVVRVSAVGRAHKPDLVLRRQVGEGALL
jgi:hypothetical protein